jgi:hypothetical protein
LTTFVAARNAELPPDRRIGVNLGDVIVAPDDIYGHGVNVAAARGSRRPAASASPPMPGAMCGERLPPSSLTSASGS